MVMVKREETRSGGKERGKYEIWILYNKDRRQKTKNTAKFDTLFVQLN